MAVKWERLFEASRLVQISGALTLLFSIPSAVILIFRPTLKYLKLAMFNVSMTFFFFSYHVHEKTILMPLAMIILCTKQLGSLTFDFALGAMVTLIPLMIEDGLLLQHICLGALYLVLAKYASVTLHRSNILAEEKMERYHEKNLIRSPVDVLLFKSTKLVFYFYRRVIRNLAIEATVATCVC